jgi:cupin domain
MRRVVTGHDPHGKSVFLSDGAPGRVVTLETLPGLEFHEVWATDAAAQLPADAGDPTIAMSSFVAPASGTRFRIVHFPPDRALERVAAEGKLLDALREYVTKLPGLAETSEPTNPAMHTTDTVDYGIVLSGEIYLELDEGAETRLTAGDCFVQNGTRHAWRNRSAAPSVVAFVMVGATRAT